MAMDTKDMMNEMGAAFAVTWLVMGINVWNDAADPTLGYELVGIGMSGIMAVAALGVVWMAFAGAHILPPITWMHMLTGELDDTEGNWMPNGMKLLMQIVGGALALIMMAELNSGYVDYATGAAGGMVTTEWEFEPITMAGGIAAGALLWCIHTKADNPWATAAGVVMMGAYIAPESATDMASMLMNETSDMQAMASEWIVTGISVGLGAMLAMKIDENL